LSALNNVTVCINYHAITKEEGDCNSPLPNGVEDWFEYHDCKATMDYLDGQNQTWSAACIRSYFRLSKDNKDISDQKYISMEF